MEVFTADYNNLKLNLGMQGENNSRQIKFPKKYFKDRLTEDELSGGDFYVIAIRDGDANRYTASEVTDDEDYVYWTLDSRDTEKHGKGKAEVMFNKSGKIMISPMFDTYTEYAFDLGGLG